jgi:hypothetical protein
LNELHDALKKLARISRVDDEQFQKSLRRKTEVSLNARSRPNRRDADLKSRMAFVLHPQMGRTT